MGEREKIICMATDAFRLCIGVPLRNFAPADVVRYVTNLARAKGKG